VRETSRERAQGDQGLALPGRGLDGPRGAVQPLDEVPAEREPGVDLLAQHGRGHPEYPPAGCPPARREIDALLIPGAESSGPAARHVHPPHDGVLRPDMAYEVNSPVNEHPPEVRALALTKKLDAGLDRHLGTAVSQFRELAVVQAVEQADRAKLAGAYHAGAGLLMSYSLRAASRLPGGEAGGTKEMTATL
jgi:hypothetical protein